MTARRVGLLVVGAAAAAAALGVVRYRRDLDAARQRLSAVRSTAIGTRFGTLEYAESGSAERTVLVSHGIFHGCDGALVSVRDVIRDRHVLAPSRFGYLGSDLPEHAGDAEQADAFVELLDHLGIDSVDVFGISAGTGAAVQTALRHPDRVDHLVISSGNWPGSTTSAAPPPWAKLFYSDPAMWAVKLLGGRALGALMGVPDGFPHDDAEQAVITELADSIFPVAPRRPGAVFDAFVSNPQINACPLEELTVPTMIVHAVDDPLASYSAAQRAAERIPAAQLVSLTSGGHLGLGQAERVHREVMAFLDDTSRPDG